MKRLVIISVATAFLLSLSVSIGWASPCCDGDYNCDSKVNFQDYVAFVGDFISGLLKIEPSEICVNASIPKTGQTTPHHISQVMMATYKKELHGRIHGLQIMEMVR